MKRINLGFLLLVVASFFVVSCEKPVNDPPVADTELQSSIDVSYATFIATDIDMISAFIGEDASIAPKFYAASPTSNGTVTVIRNTSSNRVSITFNKTTCMDGRLRDGAIFMFFLEKGDLLPNATPPYGNDDYSWPYMQKKPASGNELYTRDYNFTGRITLEEYKVDGWLVDNKDFENPNDATNNVNIFLYNLRTTPDVPVTSNLKWEFKASLKMTKDTETMAWKGTLTRTLDNSLDPKVFNATTAQSAINWSLSTVSYVGSAFGLTPGNAPFTYKIYENAPVRRNFSCSPDRIAGVGLTSTLSIDPQYSEFHPFTAGVASFTTGTAYPREIYYDNVENSFGGQDDSFTLPAQCDNKATVQIQGIYYPIDMKK